MNAELVNNLGNLANRTLSLLAGADLAKELSPAGTGPGRKLVEDALARVKEVREAFERFDYRVAMKVILEIGHSANAFLTVHEPWKSKKTDREGARAALSDAAEVAYLIAALIEPVVPRLAETLFRQFNAPKLSFAALEKAGYPLLDRGRPIGDPSPLINRMEEGQVAQLITRAS